MRVYCYFSIIFLLISCSFAFEIFEMKSRFFTTPCTCQYSHHQIIDECVRAAKFAFQAMGHAHTERAYEECMVNYFYKQRIPYLRQKPFYQKVDGQIIHVGVADIEVNHSVILELKANVKEITDDHRAQLMRYMRAANTHTQTHMGAVILFAKDGKLRVWTTPAPTPSNPTRTLPNSKPGISNQTQEINTHSNRKQTAANSLPTHQESKKDHILTPSLSLNAA